MKKLLLFICLLSPSLLFAQDIEKIKLFFNQDKETAEAFYQSILDESGKTFSFDGVESTQSRYQFKYFDESTRGTDSPRYVYFWCNKYEIGGNADLEVKGKDVYSLFQVKGKFLDFAKWWIRYVDPNETLESLSEKGKDDAACLNGEVKLLKQLDGSWIIRGY